MKFGLKTVLLGTFGGAAFMSGLHRVGPVLPSNDVPAWVFLLVGIVMLTFVASHISDALRARHKTDTQSAPSQTTALKGQL